MDDRKQEMDAKLRGYGEGVIHGFTAAKQMVSDLTNGLLTLNEPNEVAQWRERLKRAN